MSEDRAKDAATVVDAPSLILHQRHMYGSNFPQSAMPFVSNTSRLNVSSPIPAQAITVDASPLQETRNACASAASLAHLRLEPNVKQPDRFVNGCNGLRNCYSKELKLQFCLFKRNWIAARTDRNRCGTWASAERAFFESKPQFSGGSIPNDRVTRLWWTQYLEDQKISTGGDPGWGGSRGPTSSVGISSEDVDPAGGGLNYCMGNSHGGDAEQSGAGGCVFADASAAGEDAEDAALSPPGESLSSVAARAADAARSADAARAAVATVDSASDHACPATAATTEGGRAPLHFLRPP